MYMIYNIYRIFCCQAYDKKVRWTFFSYIAGNVKLSIFDMILTQFNKNSLFFNYQPYYL